MCGTGPCSSLKEYYLLSLRLILDLIIYKEMYSPHSVDAYLIHRFFLDLVPLVLPSVPDHGVFYLQHGDDKGDGSVHSDIVFALPTE